MKACISLHVPAARQGRHPRLWSGSSVRLERQPVTLEVAGSSPVRFATLFRKNSRLRAAFLHSDFYSFTVPAFRLLFQESRPGEQRFSEALGQNLLLRFVSRRFCFVATAAKRTASLPVCGKMPVFPYRRRIAFLQGRGACLI